MGCTTMHSKGLYKWHFKEKANVGNGIELPKMHHRRIFARENAI